MKTKLALFTLSAITVVACHTSKKTTTSTATAPKTEATPTAETPSVIAAVKSPKPADGVYEPGDEELVAIQIQYKDATIEQLKEGYTGYTLYAKSACISCHGTVNIYKYPVDKWPYVIQDMAHRAKLTPTQKDAVLKYVYAIKATDPNRK